LEEARLAWDYVRNETPSQAGFKLTNGHTYFPIEEEFDAIPLICFIAGKYDKAVCFLEGQGSLRHYQKLVRAYC
jgi:hypothetical protein